MDHVQSDAIRVGTTELVKINPELLRTFLVSYEMFTSQQIGSFYNRYNNTTNESIMGAILNELMKSPQINYAKFRHCLVEIQRPEMLKYLPADENGDWDPTELEQYKLMTDAHKDSIIRNIRQLSSNLDVANLIYALRETKIVHRNDDLKIMNDESKTPQQQNQYFLLNVFLQQGDWAFDELILILLNNGKQELANLLDPEKKCPLRYLAA